MTEPPIILDADFLSSFAWVNRLDILKGLYPKRMIILEEVLEELKRVPHLASKVKLSIRNGHIKRESMYADSPEALQLGKFLMISKRRKLPASSFSEYMSTIEGIRHD